MSQCLPPVFIFLISFICLKGRDADRECWTTGSHYLNATGLGWPKGQVCIFLGWDEFNHLSCPPPQGVCNQEMDWKWSWNWSLGTDMEGGPPNQHHNQLAKLLPSDLINVFKTFFKLFFFFLVRESFHPQIHSSKTPASARVTPGQSQMSDTQSQSPR